MKARFTKISLTLCFLTAFYGLVHCETEVDLVSIFSMDNQLYVEGKGGYGKYWGLLETEYSPWIRSERLGWIYLAGDSTEMGYWFWLNKLGWVYSSVENFPEAYWSERDAMILFDVTETNRIKFWDFSERQWIVAAAFGNSYKGTYEPVPAELQGIVHKSFDIWGRIHIGISVKSYYVEILRFNGLGMTCEIWYYSSSDERFYTLESTEPSLPWSYLRAGSEYQSLKIEKISDNLVLTYVWKFFESEPDVRTYPITNP